MMYIVVQKRHAFIFLNSSVKNEPILICRDVCRRRTETSNEDDENDDDIEFAPRKAIKLEDAANSAGNFCCVLLLAC